MNIIYCKINGKWKVVTNPKPSQFDTRNLLWYEWFDWAYIQLRDEWKESFRDKRI